MVNGASAALMISDIPWNGPIGCVRLGQIDGEFVVNPTNEQMYDSALDLIYVGSAKEMLMIEGSADQISEEINADIMIAFTSSGTTALISSKLNPSIPIIAPTDNEHVVRKMALFRGVIPMLMKKKFVDIDSWGQMIKMALEDAKDQKNVKTGDIAIVTAGYPLGRPGGTNSIRMIEVL